MILELVFIIQEIWRNGHHKECYFLNSSLTVNKSEAGSHRNIGWDLLTKSVIKLLNNKGGVIFLLWGKKLKNI